MPLDDLTKDELQQALYELLKVLRQEHYIIAEEIERTRNLLADAVKNVSEGFKQLQQVNVEQQNIAKLLAKKQTIDHTELQNEQSISGQLSLLAERHQQAVGTCTQALQFEDLTRQSLNSLSINITNISDIIERLRLVAECPRVDLALNFDELKNVCIDIYQRSSQQVTNKVVEQRSIDEGEIDLF